MSNSQSRFEEVSRRAFVMRALALGALVAAPGLGCSKSDKEVFSKPSTATGPTAAPTSTEGRVSTSAVASGSTASAATGSDAVGSFPAGGHLAVNFTYTPKSGGEVHSPFIAVWVENSNGELVKTISLWYRASESKYLKELQRWASGESAFRKAGAAESYDTVSGPTRIAGTYSVMWDGTNAAGVPVALGDYFICIEAAREKGPYELVRGGVKIADAAATTKLDDSGELNGVSVTIVV